MVTVQSTTVYVKVKKTVTVKTNESKRKKESQKKRKEAGHIAPRYTDRYLKVKVR